MKDQSAERMSITKNGQIKTTWSSPAGERYYCPDWTLLVIAWDDAIQQGVSLAESETT